MTEHSKGAWIIRAAFSISMLVGVLFAPWSISRSAAESVRALPAPTTDEAEGEAGSEIAVLAGGCFWGVQGVFQHVTGISKAVSGYAGGEAKTAHYVAVSGGATGHAEAVQLTFDPKKVSYGKILQIFFSVVHDPTQLNRQGPDIGTQYHSEIFPVSAEQERIARGYIAQLSHARVFGAAIVTRIELNRSFYPAEVYHQDFLANNPRNPYIKINDLPKIEALKELFPDLYREVPVLVSLGRK